MMVSFNRLKSINIKKKLKKMDILKGAIIKRQEAL